MEILVQYGPILIAIAIIFGFFMTWGIGANDVANAMGTSVGSNAITVKQAIIIAAIFEFAGAFLAGSHVTKTIRKGIIDPAAIASQPEILVFGMLAALLAAAIWLLIASWKGWPVSTTHAIVGAIVGFGIAGVGIDAVQWTKIGTIVLSWIVSPLLGGVLAYLLMISIRTLILNRKRPFEMAKRWAPMYIFMVGFIVALVTVFKGLKHLNVEFTVVESLLVAVAMGAFVSFISWLLIRNIKIDTNANRDFHYASVEKVFTPMMLFTASAMAFAHGSNDVANGIGPLAAVVSIVQSGGQLTQQADIPVWILLLGGSGIVLGLTTMGYRVMQTIGRRITPLTPTKGFCATLAAAATIVIASRTGLPVSTTQIAVGGVIGVGIARGIAAIDLRVVGEILISWLITLPVGGILAALIFFILKAIFI